MLCDGLNMVENEECVVSNIPYNYFCVQMQAPTIKVVSHASAIALTFDLVHQP